MKYLRLGVGSFVLNQWVRTNDSALKKIGEESRMFTVSSDATIELDRTILERGQLKTSVSFIGCCQNAKLYATENLPPDGESLA